MSLRTFQKRLTALARRECGVVRSPPPIHYGRRLPLAPARARMPPVIPLRPLTVAAALPGEEIPAPGGGIAWLTDRREAAPCPPTGPRPEGDLFVDIESTGLGSSPLFLIGVMTWEEGELRVRQFLARDYSEEAAVISLFLEDAGARERLVSFNGKSYDLPYIRMRAAATGVPFALDLPHLDLLHESRREWGDVLPNCRLQTLESMICGRHRTDDIPGSEIPDAYHAFVRTGNATDIGRIAEHNRRDLVTLAELMAKL